MRLSRVLPVGAALLAVPAFAEGEPNAFDTALSTLQTGVTGIIDKIAPGVAAVAVAGLVIGGIMVAVRKAKGAVGR